MSFRFDPYPDYSAEEIEKRILQFKEKGSGSSDRKTALKLVMHCIDLTTLEGSDTHEKISALCRKAFSFSAMSPEMPDVAAVCVYPPFIATAKKELKGKGINVAAVAGAFPSGQSPLHVKLAEVAWAVNEGADEIDMVISRGTFLEGKFNIVADEIAAIKKECRHAHLKVILETGELQTAANIRKASEIAILSGADFIKTSTGKIQPAATEFAAVVMLDTLKEYFEKTGRKIGFKPAGGISEPDQALNYLMLVQQILGDGWMNKHLLRFGASRLADKLAAEIIS